MPVRAKDVGQATNFHVHYGEQAHHETKSSFPTNNGVQSSCGSAGDGDGVLQHNLTMLLGEGQSKEMLKQIRWNLREEVKSLPLFDECSNPDHVFIMNKAVQPTWPPIELTRARPAATRFDVSGGWTWV